MIRTGGDTPSTDQHRFATMGAMPVPSARLKTYTVGHLDFHASQRWPQLEEITIAWRGSYGYVTAHLPDDEQLPLCRLRYLGSDTDWGFALYHASSETYDDTLLPHDSPTGTPEQALDCALGLYLADPSTWIKPPKDLMRCCTSALTRLTRAALPVRAAGVISQIRQRLHGLTV